jgi:hypothetical protein
MISEIKESMQRSQTQPDLTRKANEGGLQNKTLGAAQMQQGKGDIMENDLNLKFSYCEEDQAYKVLRMLQQYAPEIIDMRMSPKEGVQQVPKWEILGDFAVSCNTTYSANKTGKFAETLNRLNAILNFLGNPHPAIQRINPEPFVREFLDTSNTIDIDEAYPEPVQQQQQQGAPMIPGMQLPAPEAAPEQNPMGEQANVQEAPAMAV